MGVSGHIPATIRDSVRGTVVQNLYNRVLYHRTAFCGLTIPTPIGEMEVVVPQQTQLISHVKERDGYEPVLTEELISYLDGDTVFWDIGGRFGEFSKLALKCGVRPQNTVSVEGNTYRHQILKRNHRYDDIHTVPQFVGDGGSDVSLDQLRRQYPPPDVLKIDVEGAEHAVIAGAEATLWYDSPRLYVEVHPQKMSLPAAEIVDTIKQNGYTVDMADHRTSESEWRPFDKSNAPTNVEYLIRCVAE